MNAFGDTAEHHCEGTSGDEIDHFKEWNRCKKNEGHKHFFTVDKFGKGHLPPDCRTDEFMNDIQIIIDRTVKITVFETSKNRPGTLPDSQNSYPFLNFKGKYRLGTGYIFSGHRIVGKKCPCPICKRSTQPRMEYWEVGVITATHVVFDLIEAKSSVIEAFYDKESKEGVKYLYGFDLQGDAGSRYQMDQCWLECVTHDKTLGERLKVLCDYGRKSLLTNVLYKNKVGILVSHPHGVSKRISIGKMLETTIFVEQECSITLKKGSRVFIPFNADRQENNSNHGNISNILPHEEIKSSLSHSMAVEYPQTETATSWSWWNFKNLLNPTIDKEVFELKYDLEALVPLKSRIDCNFLESPLCYTFPAGTKYVTSDKRSVIAQTKIKIYSETRENIDHIFDYCFLNYEMASCPGSSGAFVHGHGFLYSGWCHFGCEEGRNRSGLSLFLYDDSDEESDDNVNNEDDDEMKRGETKKK